MSLRVLAALSLILTLAACATPAVQPPMTPPPGFAGPAVEARALVVDDGARLPLARWSPEGEPWAVIVALHGMNDSRASFRLAGPWWAEQGIETWAIDQRGFGEVPGRGVWAGEALTPLRVISFVFIWGGAGVFAAAALFRHKAAREALKRTAEPV